MLLKYKVGCDIKRIVYVYNIGKSGAYLIYTFKF